MVECMHSACVRNLTQGGHIHLVVFGNMLILIPFFPIIVKRLALIFLQNVRGMSLESIEKKIQ